MIINVAQETKTDATWLIGLFFKLCVTAIGVAVAMPAALGFKIDIGSFGVDPSSLINKIVKQVESTTGVSPTAVGPTLPSTILPGKSGSCKLSRTLPADTATVFRTAASQSWLDTVRAAKLAGFTGECLVMATAEARAESGLRPEALNFNGAPKTCDYSHQNSACRVDVGVWQINTYWHPEVGVVCSTDINCAAHATYRITNRGSNWNSWCTSGPAACGGLGANAYSRYVPEARLAVRLVS